MAIWSDTNLSKHDTIEAALAEVPYFNKLMQKDKKVWINDPCQDGEFSRFDADTTIDWDFNADSPDTCLSPETIESWKAGKIMLYAMHAVAYIEVSSDLSAEDVKDFVNA